MKDTHHSLSGRLSIEYPGDGVLTLYLVTLHSIQSSSQTRWRSGLSSQIIIIYSAHIFMVKKNDFYVLNIGVNLLNGYKPKTF